VLLGMTAILFLVTQITNRDFAWGGESYRLTIICQVVARDSGVGVREAEARAVELASAVMDVVYGSGTGYELAVGLTGWTVRAQFDGLTFQSARMEHGGYSALGFVGMQINGTRC
jgi:hypothetical protein